MQLALPWHVLDDDPNDVSLPRSVQQVADVIGRDKALYLVSQLPRTYSRNHPNGQVWLYVPCVLDADHRLARWLGLAEAAALVAAFRGEILELARCAQLSRAVRNQGVLRLLLQGYAVDRVASVFGLSSRMVRNIWKSRQRKAPTG
ncbi:hypothetical protein EO087_01790 [Dyella sp. M7H15-1]|uniref:hypothetical protein n=1 Tax=Dyella sp. M7H15-1 TaxID=2501295 RepID=UPI001004E440|nr:hypothetical protein [Dyella sp. M7H15-1]QAU22875.1 hypothetical protein EO087_01790 [Dyella sp. M7H15-1]